MARSPRPERRAQHADDGTGHRVGLPDQHRLRPVDAVRRSSRTSWVAQEVRQVTDTLTHWRTSIGGVGRFDAQITDHPDQRVAWRSVDGPAHEGIVFRADRRASTTRVHVETRWEPDSLIEGRHIWCRRPAGEGRPQAVQDSSKAAANRCLARRRLTARRTTTPSRPLLGRPGVVVRRGAAERRDVDDRADQHRAGRQHAVVVTAARHLDLATTVDPALAAASATRRLNRSRTVVSASPWTTATNAADPPDVRDDEPIAQQPPRRHARDGPRRRRRAS